MNRSREVLRDGQSVELSCPEHGDRLMVRRNRQNDGQFLGCPRWPACTYTRGLPIDVILRQQGAMMLPGLE